MELLLSILLIITKICIQTCHQSTIIKLMIILWADKTVRTHNMLAHSVQSCEKWHSSALGHVGSIAAAEIHLWNKTKLYIAIYG